MSTCQQLFVVSGCSSGGKSSLIAALAERGFMTVEEPGRRVVRQQKQVDGKALPWADTVEFLKQCVALAIEDHQKLSSVHSPVFLDRSLIDAWSALDYLDPSLARKLDSTIKRHRYDPCVFMAPPWQSLFVNDDERKHSFTDAVAEYERLLTAYPAAGYAITVLPLASVSARVDHIVHLLDL